MKRNRPTDKKTLHALFAPVKRLFVYGDRNVKACEWMDARGVMIFPRVLRALFVARGRAGDFVEFGLRTGISDEFWLKRREPGGTIS